MNLRKKLLKRQKVNEKYLLSSMSEVSNLKYVSEVFKVKYQVITVLICTNYIYLDLSKYMSSIRLSIYSILELCSTRYCRDAHL